jgi:hypothetical protein
MAEKMANNRFPPIIAHVLPNSPVSSGNTSASTWALEDRTNYLNQAIESAAAGQLIVYRDVALATETQVGQPVYWDVDNSQFDLAQAGATAQDGVLVQTPQSDVLGLVWNKSSPVSGDVVLFGVVSFTASDLANALGIALGASIPAGRYYLSSAQAGQLVLQKPPVDVSVCFIFNQAACNDQVYVYLNPQLRNFFEDHIHYRFDLVARPAGVSAPPPEFERHTISEPNSSLPGWLPADDPIFNGLAPRGAQFGYNLSADVGLQSCWPPVPTSAVVLEMFKPDDNQLVGGFVPNEKVLFDVNGIWWMTDCYDEVPWPLAIDTSSYSSGSSVSQATPGSQSSSGSSYGSVGEQPCPVQTAMQLRLWFVKMSYMTDKTVVTSLAPGAGQPISFTNCQGEPATTGDLQAQIELDLAVSPTEQYGPMVLRTILPNNTFGVGYAVEGVLPGSSNISVVGTRTRNLVPGNTSTPLVQQGIVTIDTNDANTTRELSPVLARLDDAEDRTRDNFLYIGLPMGRDCSATYQFDVPVDAVPTNPSFMLRTILFGRTTGTLTGLTVTYMRLPRPTTATSIVQTPVGLGYNNIIAVEVDTAIEVESDALTVAPGDTVMITISRAAEGSPTFNGEIGIIRCAGILAAGG